MLFRPDTQDLSCNMPQEYVLINTDLYSIGIKVTAKKKKNEGSVVKPSKIYSSYSSLHNLQNIDDQILGRACIVYFGYWDQYGIISLDTFKIPSRCLLLKVILFNWIIT